MNHLNPARILLLGWMLTCCFSLFAQTNLSGVINSYDRVSAYSVANNAMTVATPAMWAPSDRVVVIQMNGATINTTNSSNFGTITAYNNAGNYEIATICEVSGNQVVFDNVLVNSYSPALGVVQLVKIALISGDAVIQDTVRAISWDGNTGGVIAIEATGKVTIDNPILANGQGFRGGGYENSTLGSCRNRFFNNPNDYAYGTADDGGLKGEGITLLPGSQAYGKGPAANGGGGGNDHNTGGAGGGHTGVGGDGGEHRNTAFTCTGVNPGQGGKDVTFFIGGFMGGGGGAGHGNNLGSGGGGSGGTNGGGIVIILANHIEGGTNPLIAAEGDDVTELAQADGAGGGGAGGMVHIEAPLVNGSLVVQAFGGDGGDVNNQFVANGRCFGPGGGGSGGVIKIGSGTVAGASFLNGGGVAGVSTNSTTAACNNNSLGATDGSGGAVLFGTNIPRGTVDYVQCNPLPLAWKKVEAVMENERNLLRWKLEEGPIAKAFIIQRETFIGEFLALDTVDGSNDQWLDQESVVGSNRYRIAAVDMNGRVVYSSVTEVFRTLDFEFRIVKQPVILPEDIIIEASSPEFMDLKLALRDMQGRLILSKNMPLEKGKHIRRIPCNMLSSGTYFLHAKTGRTQKVLPVIIQ